MLFIPYGFETLLDRRPWLNWAIMAACISMTLALWVGAFSKADLELLVLQGWEPTQLLGHSLLHADITHLTGNMIVLGVFGNAICSNTSNGFYGLVYLACLLASAAVHLLMDGGPAIGASGAINGIVGVALAVYPFNRVNIFWWIFFRYGTFQMQAWVLILFWLFFDLWGVITGMGGIAYWAHLGGLAFGVCFGLAALHLRWVETTEWDHPTLLDVIARRAERQ